jgi:hypothetical protein
MTKLCASVFVSTCQFLISDLCDINNISYLRSVVYRQCFRFINCFFGTIEQVSGTFSTALRVAGRINYFPYQPNVRPTPHADKIEAYLILLLAYLTKLLVACGTVL